MLKFKTCVKLKFGSKSIYECLKSLGMQLIMCVTCLSEEIKLRNLLSFVEQ